MSIRRLRPTVQPNWFSACTNAAMRACTSIVRGYLMTTPMRRIRSRCCALAAIGHAAAPPSRVMNSRRLIIRSPRRRGRAEAGTVKPSAFAVLRLMTSVLGGLLNRQVGGLSALEDAVDVACCLSELVGHRRRGRIPSSLRRW